MNDCGLCAEWSEPGPLLLASTKPKPLGSISPFFEGGGGGGGAQYDFLV